MSRAQLCALRISPADADWQRTVSIAAKGLGCAHFARRQTIDVWRPDHCRRMVGGASFVDGWRAARLWLGPSCRAVGLTSQRVYLQPDGDRDDRPEREIVDLRSRPKTPLAERLRGLQWFLEGLQASCPNVFGNYVSVTTNDVDPLDGVTLRGRKGAFSADTNLRIVHEQGGFLRAADNLEVVICRDEGVGSAPAEDYARRAEYEFDEHGVKASVLFRDLRVLEQRLEELMSGDPVKRRDVPILFMLAKRDDPPTDRLLRVMQGLEQHGLPWRRAYVDDNWTRSVADQVGSLLQAAGGHPHEVVLPDRERLPWSIGIDISHRKVSARVAATLIGPDGRLCGAWTADQARRENIDASVLRRLLKAAAHIVPEVDRAEGVLVVRDGRVFESERAEDYRRDLGGPVTLVELRKYNNPPLLLGDDLELPTRPVIGWLRETVGGSLGFLVTLPRSGEGAFGSVLKLWMHQDWDGIHLGPEQLARVLFAQTLTPGLGLQRRKLPAPVYWADGIAGASDEDLRFRGLPVVRLD